MKTMPVAKPCVRFVNIGIVRLFILSLTLVLIGGNFSKAAPVPPSNNASAPYLGLYEWSLKSGLCQSRTQWMATSMNRNTLWIEDFLATDSWASLEGDSYEFNLAAQFLRDNPGSSFVLTVGLLPGSGNTPLSGTSLANGAAGDYNSYFAALAQNLVTAGIASRTIIRLGHEFNGNWYAWQVDTDTDAHNYAAYWQQVVPAMHAVSGASGLKFCWNGAIVWDSYNVADAYPGNAYVDYVGCDIYDRSYDSDTYPYPGGDSQADILQRQENAWADNAGTGNNGLGWWANLANTNGKPFSIPEWGTWGLGGDGSGGGDDTYFIQQMYNYIQDPANNVAFHVYFDVWAGDGNHQLSQSPSEGPTNFPNSAALFEQLFAAPPLTVNNDIGTTGLTGACTAFTATGAGNGFLAGGTSDNFHFASQAITGDTLFIGQITSMSTSTGQSGLMIRQGTGTGDPYAALYLSNGNLIFQSRTTADGAAAQNFVVGSITTPIWLKMLRTGNVISGYQSRDGLNWTFAGSQTVSMTTAAYAGVAVGSGSTSVLNSTGIANVNNPDIAADVYNTTTSTETFLTPAITSAIFLDSAATSGVTQTGNWYLSGTQANLYGGTMLTAYYPSTPSTLTFAPTIPTTGQYDVYFTAPGNYQDGDQTPVTITSTNGTTTGTFNEQSNDGLWVYQGTYNFAAGTSGTYAISNGSSPGGYGYVSADGVMFVPVPLAAIAPPTGLAATPADGLVNLTWTAVTGASSYHIKRSTTSGGPYTTLASPTTANYADTSAVDGTTYYYVVSAVTGGGGESVNSTQVGATPAAGGSLPSGWTDADIGGPSPAGSASYSGGVFTVNGGGSDIWYGSDQFNFAYESGTGDQTLITRVTGLTYTSSTAKAALMFRDSTANNAIYVLLDVKPGSNGIEFYARESAGANATWIAGGSPGVTLSPTTPIWIKLAKSGTTYTAYYSTSVSTPTSWTSIGSATVSLSNSTYLTGLGVCSVDNGTRATGSFDNVSFSSGVPGSVNTVTQGTTTASSIAMSWTAATNATGYNIWVQSSAGGSGTTIPVTGTSYTLTGLTSNTWYWISLQGTNSSGGGSWTGTYSFQTNASTPAPGSVDTVTQGTTTASSIAMSWTAATNATGYNIWVQSSAGGSGTTIPVTGTSYTLTGLTSDTWYWISLQGTNSSGGGSWTGTYSFQTN